MPLTPELQQAAQASLAGIGTDPTTYGPCAPRPPIDVPPTNPTTDPGTLPGGVPGGLPGGGLPNGGLPANLPPSDLPPAGGGGADGPSAPDTTSTREARLAADHAIPLLGDAIGSPLLLGAMGLPLLVLLMSGTSWLSTGKALPARPRLRLPTRRKVVAS